MKPTHSPQPFQNLQYIFNVILSIMICLAVSGIQPVSAAPPAAHYYVDRFDDYLINSGCDDVEDTNQCDLRGAILLAHSSAGSTSQVTIHLPAGTYTLTIPGEDDMNQEGDLDISGNHVILQGAGMYSTIIDGNDLDRVIDHSGSYTLGIKDLTIRNGYRSVGVGGGIRSINAGQLSLSNVRVSGNEVVSTLYNTYGGGIYLTDTSMVMSGSIIDNNRAVMGAGLAIYNTVDGTGVVIKDSTIYENRTTDSNGGGIWAGPHSNLNVENVTIAENWADDLGNGGGIHFYNNTAARLNHVTIADNWAGGLGDAISGEYSVHLDVYNSIFYYDLGGEVCYYPVGTTLDIFSNGRNITNESSGDNCKLGSFPGIDPLLGELGYYRSSLPVIPLLPGSPAIDEALVTAPLVSTDQRGKPRCDGDGDGTIDPDAGAFEVCEEFFIPLIVTP